MVDTIFTTTASIVNASQSMLLSTMKHLFLGNKNCYRKALNKYEIESITRVMQVMMFIIGDSIWKRKRNRRFGYF
jgi:hypothetical protein